MIRRLDETTEREILPGFFARIVHGVGLTESWVRADAGAAFPAHAHPHEQLVNVLEGELELVVGDETYRLTPGTVFVIPSNVPHAGRAVTACRVLDVFSPARDEYR
ncbi:MAG: cupin domain-containing protein [Vicinamibacterales bacterium]